MTGYWGVVDSSIDWCEANYAITFYVAEFYNTISSIPMSILSIFGILLTRKYATTELRYIFVFLCIVSVGIGSAAFHGTLRFYAQLFDELPMVHNLLISTHFLQ
jgi:dihydroceramidase